jgi:mannosyltransferase OCH1-like enzyme
VNKGVVGVVLFLFVFWKSKLFKSSPSIFDVFRRNTGQGSYSEGVNTPGFPRKIWQTWKIDPLNFKERDLVRARSWSTLNPRFR